MAASSGRVAAVGELRAMMAVSGCQIVLFDAMYVCGLIDGSTRSRLVDSKSNSVMVIAWHDNKWDISKWDNVMVRHRDNFGRNCFISQTS